MQRSKRSPKSLWRPHEAPENDLQRLNQQLFCKVWARSKSGLQLVYQDSSWLTKGTMVYQGTEPALYFRRSCGQKPHSMASRPSRHLWVWAGTCGGVQIDFRLIPLFLRPLSVEVCSLLFWSCWEWQIWRSPVGTSRWYFWLVSHLKSSNPIPKHV